MHAYIYAVSLDRHKGAAMPEDRITVSTSTESQYRLSFSITILLLYNDLSYSIEAMRNIENIENIVYMLCYVIYVCAKLNHNNFKSRFFLVLQTLIKDLHTLSGRKGLVMVKYLNLILSKTLFI